MLNILRKNTKKLFIVILFLLVPPFCFFGVDMAFRALFNADFAGKIEGKTVSVDRFFVHQQETRNQMIAQLSLIFGVSSPDQLSNLRSRLGDFLTRENLNQLTWERILLAKLADRHGIPTSDEEVAAWIARYPLFQEGGRFDPARYERTLRSVFGVSSLQFEKELATTLKIERLRRIVTDAVHVSEEELQAAFAQDNEKATARVARFRAADFEGEIKLSDAELKARYDKNPEDFRVPEKIRARYMSLVREEKQSEEAFLEKATEISIALLRNSDAAEAAGDFGVTLQETPLFSRAEPVLPPAVAEKLFSSEAGEWTSPVETPSGLFLASLIEKVPSALPPFEDCRQTIAAVLKRERGAELARAEAAKKREELAGLMEKEKLSFADAAKKTGLATESPAPFTRQEAFSPLVFALPENQLSPVQPTDDGALFFAVEKKELPEFAKNEVLVERIRGTKRAQRYQDWYAAVRREMNLVDLSAFLR